MAKCVLGQNQSDTFGFVQKMPVMTGHLTCPYATVDNHVIYIDSIITLHTACNSRGRVLNKPEEP